MRTFGLCGAHWLATQPRYSLEGMILLRYSETLINANCYILAEEDTGSALVVDPGAGAAAWVRETLAARGLSAAAILLTHGHSDHVWDAAMVAGESTPVYIPGPDLYRLDNPAKFTAAFVGAFVEFSGHAWERPVDARALPAEFFHGGGSEIVPGIWLRAIPAPGHSEGSTVFLFAGDIANDDAPTHDSGDSVMFSGDVLFRDGVGRTDLPGSDPVAAQVSLRNLAQTIAPARVFFPGHGAPSTMGRELRYSLYLREAVNGQ